jgi:hypothetical protein
MITINHLRSKHNITLEDFKSMFPGFEMECKALKTKRQHESGGLHPGQYLKSTWSTRREWMIARQKLGDNTPKELARKSGVSKRLWSNPDWVNRRRDKNVECVLNDGTKMYVRSSYERYTCYFLDNLGISFEYESHVFKYFFKGSYRNYIVDFYLPLYDLYLEVKPKSFECWDINIAKLDSVRNCGKTITYVDEDWIKDTDSFKAHLKLYIKI